MSDFTKKRLWIWLIAMAIAAAGLVALYRYVEPPTVSVITQKDIRQALIRAGRPTSIAQPPVYVPIEIKRSVRVAIGNLGFERNSENETIQDLVLTRLSGTPGLELV
jgi:hypothetical protein